ncbi:sugar ABC transporter substrate-binding protein [Paenarthrobacter sp. OM7]|uniref:Sugar ABC transporter substrate-binding protein n=1 Tax=Paenarthrobacter sp. AMU7 TaxID=3162492 RepID=A0AB39YVX9_9MICC|nr:MULTISPECIES: sugar ABC transporter substrate-binding protein [Micrococcaceae]QSZ48737.1 D-ribose-binding protein [Arthrobacter sp. D5-1]WGM22464.1 sugar ABC transporter substrate-binding protein [Paenarthrobacter sp. OM7]
MKTSPKLAVLAVVSAATIALTGCGAPSAAQESNDGTKTKKIAVLLYSQSFEFMVALGQGVKDKAEELGVEVTVLDAKGDSSTQISQIQDQLAQGVDGIVLSPNNSAELVPGVQMIHDAGKTVTTVDSVIPGDIADAAVAFDNEKAGKLGAEALAKLMEEKGTVLEYQGAKGAYHATLRGKGFSEGIQQFPGIKVIGRDAQWTADNALSLTVDNFTADSSINGLFSHNDEMVRGIVSGLSQINKDAPVGAENHIPLVGVDGTPLALERIRNGTQDATMDQNPFEMGALALQAQVDLLDGKQVPKMQLTDTKLITKENVDDPTLWGNIFKD